MDEVLKDAFWSPLWRGDLWFPNTQSIHGKRRSFRFRFGDLWLVGGKHWSALDAKHDYHRRLPSSPTALAWKGEVG